MDSKLLDIIVTHHDEPWEVCKPFFDMIEYQSCVNYNQFSLTLVQDGETGIPWERVMKEYSFKTTVVTIPHSGPAIARNTGMKHSDAAWIMFCDIDDRFADVCALSMILSQLPRDDYDVIWGSYISEQRWSGGHIYIQKNDTMGVYDTTCMFFRREHLEQNHIQFDPRTGLYYEYCFNSLLLECTEPYRVVHLTTDFYMYNKTHRFGSMRQTERACAELIASRYNRDKLLADAFRRRGMTYAYRKRLAHIVCSEFFRVYDPVQESEPAPFTQEFLEFYRENRENAILNDTEMDVISDVAETEIMSLIQDIYNEHKIEYYLVNDTLSFGEWLDMVNTALTAPVAPVEVPEHPTERHEPDPEPVTIPNEPYLLRSDDYDGAMQIPDEEPTPEPEKAEQPRVVVYCGTYNTYLNMATSAKSLLWHTKVDKIYFLIEDDKFPYELPDDGIIECINVKNQSWFPSAGPNYDNAWSYMCMMRAAFTKLIPYDKILSFDIDIVVQEDISCLWDVDMTDCYLAGVAEPQRQKSTKDPMYINFGVVMMDLEKIRRDGIDDKVIAALNSKKYGCPEQDAFNEFCAWHIKQIPNDYNATIHSHITGEYERERIIHYAGIKFWRHYGQVKEYAIKPWSAVMERQYSLR